MRAVVRERLFEVNLCVIGITGKPYGANAAAINPAMVAALAASVQQFAAAECRGTRQSDILLGSLERENPP